MTLIYKNNLKILLLFILYSVSAKASLDEIRKIISASQCAKYKWPEYGSKNREKAPLGYINGVAMSYVRSFCRLKNNDEIAIKMSQATELQNTKTDALAHYSREYERLELDIFKNRNEILKSLYTLAFGLGMMESSGCYYEGWDVDAGKNRESDEAEAGLFQSSFNILKNSSILKKLYSQYKNSEKSCLLENFRSEVSCHERALLGTEPNGLEFQRRLKSCPALATELAVLSLREQRTHYYPINTRTAELAKVCFQMLSEIEKQMIENSYIECQEIR